MKKIVALAFACSLLTANAEPLPIALETPHFLTTEDWHAVCTHGSPNDASGCLGNTSSKAFHKISEGTGGFTTWANIQPENAPESVFIKAFLANTNRPASPPNISVQVAIGAARCALFTTAGKSIGFYGINNLNPRPGNIQIQTNTFGLIMALNMSSGGFTYEHVPIPPEANPEFPIYVMCVSYDPLDGATAVSTASSIIAI